MSYREKDIVREGERHWILRKGVGHYELYRTNSTHSVRCGVVSFRDDDEKALRYVNEAFERREAM